MHFLPKAQIAHLKADEVPIEVPSKYIEFVNIFLPKLVVTLSKYMGINNHVIKLIYNRQLPYGLIYSLSIVELKILKSYIKNNLANSFIRPFKSLAETPILFNKRPDMRLTLYVNYQGFNNLTIKNRYPLPLV